MRLPDVQDRLKAMAALLENPTTPSLSLSRADIAKQLRVLVVEIYRRPRVRQAPAKARHVDKALRDQLRQYAIMFPDQTYQEIAVQFGVTAGRVSEALAGKRK
jgi:hypothetical protein